jgi:regulator of sirC expression with transglutaminase-like and TPR domain
LKNKQIYRQSVSNCDIYQKYFQQADFVEKIYQEQVMTIPATCQNCGNDLQQNARFCSACGAPVSKTPASAEGQSMKAEDGRRQNRLIPLALTAAAAVILIIVVVILINRGPSEKAGFSDMASTRQATHDRTAQGDLGVMPGTSPAVGETESDLRSDAHAPPSGESGSETDGPADTPEEDGSSGTVPDGQDVEPISESRFETGPPSVDSAFDMVHQDIRDTQAETPPLPEDSKPAPDPEASARLNEEGLALAQSGKLNEAALRFSQATEANPENVSAWNNLGLALRRLGRIEEAVNAYEMALKTQPDFALAHKNLGVALEEMGRLQQAAEAYGTYVQLSPSAPDAAQVEKRAHMLFRKPE